MVVAVTMTMTTRKPASVTILSYLVVVYLATTSVLGFSGNSPLSATNLRYNAVKRRNGLFVGSTSRPLLHASVSSDRQLLVVALHAATQNPDDAGDGKNEMMIPMMPDDMVQYSQAPKAPKRFTAETIPSGLLKDHSTKPGTWGKIRVFRGRLEYQITDERFVGGGKEENANSKSKTFIIDTNSPPGVILPEIKHHVKPLTDDVEFVVEFYRSPGTGPVDEPREGL